MGMSSASGAFGAEGGSLHLWSLGDMLGDGEWGERAGMGSLTISEMHSHYHGGCPWEENWAKDLCLHSGSQCV